MKGVIDLEDRETFNIYSFKMFLYLLDKGFKPVGTKQQAEDTSKTIYFFEDTPEIRTAAHEYSNIYKKVQK